MVVLEKKEWWWERDVRENSGNRGVEEEEGGCITRPQRRSSQGTTASVDNPRSAALQGANPAAQYPKTHDCAPGNNNPATNPQRCAEGTHLAPQEHAPSAVSEKQNTQRCTSGHNSRSSIPEHTSPATQYLRAQTPQQCIQDTPAHLFLHRHHLRCEVHDLGCNSLGRRAALQRVVHNLLGRRATLERVVCNLLGRCAALERVVRNLLGRRTTLQQVACYALLCNRLRAYACQNCRPHWSDSYTPQ